MKGYHERNLLIFAASLAQLSMLETAECASNEEQILFVSFRKRVGLDVIIKANNIADRSTMKVMIAIQKSYFMLHFMLHKYNEAYSPRYPN